jgi:hypothetical protein
MKIGTKTKILCSLSIVVFLMFISAGFSTALAANSNIKVYVDGKKINFDVPPMIIDGSTMVPLRAIFEAIGAEVTWDPNTQMATAYKDDTSVSLYIGSLSPSVNNIVRPITVPAKIVNGRTLAPLRFVGEAFGGTVTWNAATQTINIYTTPATNTELPKTPIDFSVSSSDLKFIDDYNRFQTYVMPGSTIRIEVKIHKKDIPSQGGGKVRLSLGGMEIDKIPFYIDKGKTSIIINRYYQLPLNNYPTLTEGEQTNVGFKAEIQCDNLARDTNTSNNSAQIPVKIQGGDRPTNEIVSDSTISSIKALSDFGVGLAKSGSYLTLIATIRGSGGKTIVGFYINGTLIDETSTVPSNAGTRITCSYYVPYENPGLINYTVKLDNGDEAFIPISVAPFEFEAIPGSITWNMASNTKNYIPGQTMFLTAKVMRMNKNAFSDTYTALRAYFLIDGKLSPGLAIEQGGNLYIGAVNYTYKIPQNQTLPLKVKLIVDPGGLFAETRKDNNSDSVSIPMNIEGTKLNNISINNKSIRFAPWFAEPGEKMGLIATIKNNSAETPKKSVKVLFKINGQPIESGDLTIERGYLKPGQTYTAFKLWTVPANLTSDVEYSVEIDPEGVLTGDNKADNTASITIPVARPDLAVENNSLTSAPYLVSGHDYPLTARIYNCGPVNAEGVDVVFYINNAEVGRKIIDMPAFSTIDMQSSCTAPVFEVPEDNLPMSGVSGYFTPKMGSSSINYTVKIDPEDKIEESNENNNSAGPKELLIFTPSSKGIVYAEILDMNEDPISNAMVQLTSGSSQATAITNANGCCTFVNVPEGSYQLDVTKSGYTSGRTFDEYLYGNNGRDYAAVYLDNRSTLKGTVTSQTGAALEGVKALVNGTSSTGVSDSAGNYTLRIAAGTYTVKYTKAGYQPKVESFMISSGTEIIRNITMNPTDKAYLNGNLFDKTNKPIPGLGISIQDVSGQTLATTVSNSSGHYSMEIPLAAEEMLVAVIASHGGINIKQGIYMTKGLEESYDIYFVPPSDSANTDANANPNGQFSSDAKVAPWVVCASMPGTFFNPDYKVEAIYGTFNLNVSASLEDSNITNFNLTTVPEFWIYSSVSSSWNPAEIFAVNKYVEAYNTISAILPTSIPLAVNMHSVNMTKVWVKKIALISEGEEIAAIYPDAVGQYTWAPNKLVNLDNCKIKLYLKVDPDNGVVNPAAGYGKDRVLIEWNPKTKAFTKIGNYVVTGWNENSAVETYMDE